VSPEEYRACADECLGWAKTAKTETERQTFLQMAATWLQAGAIAAGKISRHSVFGSEDKEGTRSESNGQRPPQSQSLQSDQ